MENISEPTKVVRLNSNGEPRPIMPENQKCMRHMKHFGKSEEDAPLATSDYNGHGYFVCQHCDNILNNQFEGDYA